MQAATATEERAKQRAHSEIEKREGHAADPPSPRAGKGRQQYWHPSRRTVAFVPPVVESLPPCRIRPSCRWFAEQGKHVCFRCPVIVTDNYVPSPAVAAAAQPPGTTV